jgi:hypothetical protein
MARVRQLRRAIVEGSWHVKFYAALKLTAGQEMLVLRTAEHLRLAVEFLKNVALHERKLQE